MTFIQLVSALKLIDAQLAQAIATDDPTSRTARLLRDSAGLLERIEAHVPSSATELREMIGFFSRRSLAQRNPAAGRHDYEVAISLARRFGAGPFSSAPAENVSRTEISRAIAGAFELARMITGSRDCIAAIDSGYRLLAVSPAQARSLRSSPVALIDGHLCEALGPERFERQARPRLDLSFRGLPQDYVYLHDDPIEGRRVIRCVITPIKDTRNRIYCALLNSRDVTSQADQSEPQPQKEPGTT